VAITDRDWRLFTELRERACERFAEETLARVLKVILNEAQSAPDRQTDLQTLVAERGREKNALFNDYRRSTVTLRLHMMVQHGLVTDEELDSLSLDVRRKVG
jgi:hypothetical protein